VVQQEPRREERLSEIAVREKQEEDILGDERGNSTVTAEALILGCQLLPKKLVDQPIRGNKKSRRQERRRKSKAKYQVDIVHVVNFWQSIDVMAYSVEHARQQASDMTDNFYNLEDAEGEYKRYEPGEVTVYGPLPLDDDEPDDQVSCE
jgi:hypothetical protein